MSSSKKDPFEDLTPEEAERELTEAGVDVPAFLARVKKACTEVQEDSRRARGVEERAAAVSSDKKDPSEDSEFLEFVKEACAEVQEDSRCLTHDCDATNGCEQCDETETLRRTGAIRLPKNTEAVVSLLSRNTATDDFVLTSLLNWYRMQNPAIFEAETEAVSDVLIDNALKPGHVVYVLGAHAGCREDVEALVAVLRGAYLAKELDEADEKRKAVN